MLSRITRISELLQLNGALFIADIGAALLAETPVYAPLVLEHPDAHLFSFDGDPRQIAALKARYGSKATVLEHYVGDGEAHTAYVCEETSGMTSLFKPSPRALSFFNGFEDFGRVLRTERVQTARLDSIAAIERIDFLKMDIRARSSVYCRTAPRHCASASPYSSRSLSWACTRGNPALATSTSGCVPTATSRTVSST